MRTFKSPTGTTHELQRAESYENGYELVAKCGYSHEADEIPEHDDEPDDLCGGCA